MGGIGPNFFGGQVPSEGGVSAILKSGSAKIKSGSAKIKSGSAKIEIGTATARTRNCRIWGCRNHKEYREGSRSLRAFAFPVVSKRDVVLIMRENWGRDNYPQLPH